MLHNQRFLYGVPVMDEMTNCIHPITAGVDIFRLYPGYLPASSPSPRPSGRNGVGPLCMGSSIAAMPAMRVDARHAKRQVYQPGLNPLSRAKLL